MKALALRSIPLSEDTRNGWHAAGVKFARRKRNHVQIEALLLKYGYDTVINLGDFGFDTESGKAVWNKIETVNAVMQTSRLRETLDGFGMPLPTCQQGPHWIKTGGSTGWGGDGVQFHEDTCDVDCFTSIDVPNGDLYGVHSGPNSLPPAGVEVQQHIEGIEYRVITVGDKIVQAMRKDNCEWNNGSHSFEFNWVGVAGINNNGIIPLLKDAIKLVPNWERSILGWDVIRDSSRPYILECNTCPGVNEATAKRIVKVMEDDISKV